MNLIFGPDWQREFWASRFALRFELNPGGEYIGPYVTKFTASYDRARCIARMALPHDNVVAIVAEYPDPSAEMNAEWHGWTTGSGFEHLSNLGVSTDGALASWSGYWWPDDQADPEAEPWAQRAISVTWEQADILIWNQVAMDLGVAPQAPVQSKLVDPAHGVFVNVYDDRGMDVISLTKQPTAELYDRCTDWLLDYSRSRMAAAFES